MHRDGQTVPVSALIPAYNRAGKLGRALTSIEAQSGIRPAEVLVIDDGSNDGTSEVAERFGARVVRHEKNRGVSSARNSGLGAAGQPWVAFLDSDDEWLPHHLSTVWALRRGHVLVADTALGCGSDPLRYKRRGPLSRDPERLTDPSQLLFPGNRIPTSGTLIKRESLLGVGGFRPPDGVEDFDMWLRLLERGTAMLSPRIGVIYHIHTDQLSTDVSRMHDDHIAVVREYSGRPWFSEHLIERWRGQVIWDQIRHALHERQYAQALRDLARLAGSSQRIYGAARFAVARTRNLRAGAKTARDGRPSVAMLIRDDLERGRALKGIGDRPLIDLSESRRVFAYAQLLHRPTSLAVVDSKAGASLLRLAGIRTFDAGRESDVLQ